ISLGGVRRRLADPVLWVVVAGAGVGLLLVGVANFVRYGDPTSTGRQITTGTDPVWGNPLVGLAGLLVSPAKSIFLYSPTCVLALVGLRRLLTREPNRFAPIAACLA